MVGPETESYGFGYEPPEHGIVYENKKDYGK